MENTLQHHGILGQRWGVRRYQNADGTLTEAGKKRYGNSSNSDTDTDKATAKASSTSKKVSEMSDTELKEKISRLQLEKQYKDLSSTESGKTTVSKGKQIASEVLETSGKKVLTTALTGAALYAVKAAVSDEFDRKELGSAIFNGGPKKK